MIRGVLVGLFISISAYSQTITTVAGNGTLGAGGDGGLAISAQLYQPGNIVVDSIGNLYIGDPFNHKIRKVDKATGVISTYAGDGTPGHSGDGGPAIYAQLLNPGAMALDSVGNLFFGGNSHYIRKVEASSGIISTIAGTGNAGFGGDGGPASNAVLNYPGNIAFDRMGNMYISDLGNRRIRKIDINGIISTIAGTGTMGYSGDGGAAQLANINSPTGIACDDEGNVYFSDNSNGRTRKVDVSTDIITTVAGNGTFNYVGDGVPATSTSVDSRGIVFDKEGRLFLAEVNSNRVRMVDENGIIHTVVGTGTPGFSGDYGPALLAQLNGPVGISFDSCNNLFIGDNQNRRIRKVSFNPNCWPLEVNVVKPLSFSVSPNPASGYITIQSGSKLKEISVCNSLGQQMLQASPTGEHTDIDIYSLAPGFYFVTVTDVNGMRLSRKLLKE